MSTDETRILLVRAAEELFLERGIDGVSLREISLRAGQKNPSAAAYHFEDKPGIINAILERHSTAIQLGWMATLRHLDACRVSPTIEQLATLFVRPIFAKVDDPDGGLAYLSVCGELTVSKTLSLTDTRAGQGEGAMELIRRFMLLVPPMDSGLQLLRMLRIATLLYGGIHDYLLLQAKGITLDREHVIAELIAAVSSAIRASS